MTSGVHLYAWVRTPPDARPPPHHKIYTKIMDFMKCEWDENGVANVSLVVKDYPENGVTLDELKPIIEEIRERSTAMIIKADLAGAPLASIERFKLIVKIVKEVVDYTRDDNLLRQIQIYNTGFVFRTLYKPISFAIPKYFRDIVVFL